MLNLIFHISYLSHVCQEFSRINHMYAYTNGQFCNFGQVRIFFHKYDGNICERNVRICHTCVNFTGVTNTFISVTCLKLLYYSFIEGICFLFFFRIWCSFGEIKFDLTLVFSSFGIHE